MSKVINKILNKINESPSSPDLINEFSTYLIIVAIVFCIVYDQLINRS